MVLVLLETSYAQVLARHKVRAARCATLSCHPVRRQVINMEKRARRLTKHGEGGSGRSVACNAMSASKKPTVRKAN